MPVLRLPFPPGTRPELFTFQHHEPSGIQLFVSDDHVDPGGAPPDTSAWKPQSMVVFHWSMLSCGGMGVGTAPFADVGGGLTKVGIPLK